MKNTFKLLFLTLLATSCKNDVEFSSVDPVHWENRSVDISLVDSLIVGTTYLSVYSEIYSMTEHRSHDLTATISLRNINRSDTVYITKAEYFNTKGNAIRTYLDSPVFIAPMETVEIVIDERDQEGGSGANFLFDWAVQNTVHEPLIEGVMISTSGQQGVSFVTQGKRVN